MSIVSHINKSWFKKPGSRWLTLALVLFLFSFSIATTYSPSDAQTADCQITVGPWQTAASIPYYHIEGATAVVNGKLYVIAGFKDTSLNTSGRVDVYNPATNKWETPRASLPVNLSHAQAAFDGKYIWLAGGFLNKNPGKPTKQVWKYDTTQDKWLTGPSLPAPRAGGGLALAGRTLHYFGGTAADHDTAYANHWTLNLDNLGAGWKSAPDLPNKRIHAAGAYINGNVYAIGGQYRHDHNPVDVNLLHAFKVSTNTWSKKANLPMPRSHFEPGTIVYNNQIIIVGGRANQSGGGNGQLKQVTTYNPANNTWTELRQLPIKLIAPNAAVINNKIIVTAGGTDWHTGQKKTFVASISATNCGSDSQSTPAPEPTSTGGGTDGATSGAYSVYISVDPPNNSLNGSTYSDGSFLVTNNSQNNLKITQLKFDMRPAILPDLAFDPNGTAGDVVGKAFKPNNGTAATGYSSASYQYAFDGGYAGLTVNFNNFTPGKTFKFSIDIDPTSIHGASQPGPSESGSISGLEMVGTLVTVKFNDGTSITTTLFRKGTTNDASEATVKKNLPPKPTISVVGISTLPATVSKASQKIHVTGKANATVKLLVLDTALYINGSGYHVSAYEANSVVKIKQYTATIGGSGSVDIPVTLTRTNSKAGYNYMMAVVSSGGISGTSNRVVVRYVP